MNLRERMKLMNENREEKYKSKTERLQHKQGVRSERYKVVKEMSESKSQMLKAKEKELEAKQSLTATRFGGVKKALRTFKKEQPTMTVKRVKGKKKKGRQIVERQPAKQEVAESPFFLGGRENKNKRSPFSL